MLTLLVIAAMVVAMDAAVAETTSLEPFVLSRLQSPRDEVDLLLLLLLLLRLLLWISDRGGF